MATKQIQTIEEQFEKFLKMTYKGQVLPDNQLRAIKNSFYSGFSMMWLTMTTEIVEMEDEVADVAMNALDTEIKAYWDIRSKQN